MSANAVRTASSCPAGVPAASRAAVSWRRWRVIWRSCQATRIASTSGKYLYKVARPMPAAAAICDIVTDARPCSRASAAVVSRVASWTARRCSSIVSVHSFGTLQGYMMLTSRQIELTATLCLDKTGGHDSTEITKGSAMLTAEADIRTEHAARYLARLCGHAGKMGTGGRGLGHRRPSHAHGDVAPEVRHVECSGTEGTVSLNWGQ